MEAAFKIIKKQWYFALLAGICILGMFLRLFQYWDFPVFGETQDEFAWTFLGSSLLQKGEPTSWSYFAPYTQKEHVVLRGESYWFVTPALDHPPLFSLIPGLASTLKGTAWKDFPSIKVVRFPMVIIGSANVVLLAWWLYRATGKTLVTLASTAVLATAPSMVFLSRLAVSENLLLTWLLLILVSSTFTKVPRWITFVIHMALPLTKISGLAIGVGSAVALYQRKKDWKSAALGVVFGVFALCLYAWAFDWQLFLAVQLQQSQRDAGLLTFFLTQLWSNVLVAKPFTDTWITLGWWSALGAIFWKKAPKEWRSTDAWATWQYLFLAQLAFLALSVGEHTVHGWYKIVFFPFFALGIGMAVQWVVSQKHWLGLASSIIIFAATIRSGLFYFFGPPFFELQSLINKAWYFLAGSTILPTVVSLPKTLERNIWRTAWLILTVVVIVCNCVLIFSITHQEYGQDALYLDEGIRP